MVKKTMPLRSQRFKDLLNKMKKMNAVQNIITPDTEKKDLIVISNKIPTFITVK